MPRRDGTGPAGRGQKQGRGMGGCPGRKKGIRSTSKTRCAAGRRKRRLKCTR